MRTKINIKKKKNVVLCLLAVGEFLSLHFSHVKFNRFWDKKNFIRREKWLFFFYKIWFHGYKYRLIFAIVWNKLCPFFKDYIN